MDKRLVVLVDAEDRELGTAGIEEAHQGEGKKHRALSVILYRRSGGKVEILHQKRSASKPVFADLWSNTCCTNMVPGDEYLPRAVTRLKEEMGIEIDQERLKLLYKFSYQVSDPKKPGWCENELDAVIVGEWSGDVAPNPDEASDHKWIELEELKKDIETNPGIYAPWHKMIINDPRFVEEVI